MMQAIAEAQHFCDNLKPVRIESVSVNVLCDGDIAVSIERGQEVKSLKHKTNFVAAQKSALGVRHRGEIVSVHQNFSACGARKSADYIKQSGFPAAGRSH